ncbi:MAG: hypothetical protein ACO24H_10340 [Polynucleobacter sp.]
MRDTVIESGSGYTITSHGNGFAYTIVRDSDSAQRYLQGDDAVYFSNEYEDLSIDHNSPETRASRFSWPQLLDEIVGGYFD